MQGYALIANIVRKQEARLSGRLEGEYAIFRHGYSSPRVAGTLSYRSGDRLIELQAARYREIDDEHGFGSRNRFTPDGSPLRLVDYAQPEGTSYTELSGNYRQPLFGGAFAPTACSRAARCSPTCATISLIRLDRKSTRLNSSH